MQSSKPIGSTGCNVLLHRTKKKEYEEKMWCVANYEEDWFVF